MKQRMMRWLWSWMVLLCAAGVWAQAAQAGVREERQQEAAAVVGAQETEGGLQAELQGLTPFVGRTWRGGPLNSPEARAITDISRWERALNGRAVRIVHSLNNGEYGGESLIFWDAQKQAICFHYITTAGFHTSGTLTVSGRCLSTHEIVSGHPDGISEVRGETELLADGRMQTRSRYLKNGEWREGHSFLYEEDAQARVVFH